MVDIYFGWYRFASPVGILTSSWYTFSPFRAASTESHPLLAKEIFLYMLKFAAEGLINSAQSHGIEPPPLLSRLAAFVIMGSLMAVYEKEPQHLKTTAVKPLNLMFKPKQ